jgi:hypothetical protein
MLAQFSTILEAWKPVLPLLAFAVVVKIVMGILRRPRNKGRVGELGVNLSLFAGLDAADYQRFSDVMLPHPKNGWSQIDHVIVSPFGVFVLETKNYSGWIFGTAEDARWTVSYAGGRSKKSFLNPLRQNRTHVQAVENWLGLMPSEVIGLVIFVGEAKFKTDRPEGVLVSGWVPAIKARRERVFDDARLAELLSRMGEAKQLDTPEARAEHLEQVGGRGKSGQRSR